MNPIPRRHFLSVPFAAAASASIYAHGGQRDASPGGVRRLTHPGFLDLQVNGFAGVDFNDPATSVEQIEHALAVLRSHGVTRLLPTIIVGPFDEYERCARTLLKVRTPAILGLHLEGPYISPEEGAQGRASPRRHGPCLDRRLQTAAGRRRWTRAPGDDCAGSAGRARTDRAPARHGHPRRDRPHRRYARADPDAGSAPAPRSPRISGTAARRCCRAIRTSSGNNWPPTSCWRRSSWTAIICRPLP